MLNGFCWGVDAHYFFNKHFGIGINANGFHTSSGTHNINEAGTLTDIIDKQSIIYLGPAFACRFDTKHFLFTTNTSMGIIIWKEKFSYLYDTYAVNTGGEYGYIAANTEKYNEEVVGFSIGGAAEYKISKYLAVGAKLSLTLGRSAPEYSSTGVSFTSIVKSK